MKFELSAGRFNSAAAIYLVIRYRAENLHGGYALWLNDEHAGGMRAADTSQLDQDGRWHILAVDLLGVGVRGFVESILTEVQCEDAPASISFDYIRLSDALPEGAMVVPKQLPENVERIVDPAALADSLQPRPDWLAAVAGQFGAVAEDGLLHLHAIGGGKGMKWSALLQEPIDLSKYRFAAIRYRARGTEPWGDYVIWLGSGAGGRPTESAQLINLRDLRATDTWQVAVVDLSAEFEAVNMAFQVGSREERGDIWLDSIRLTSRRPLLDIGDLLPMKRGWSDSRLPRGGFRAVDIQGATNRRAEDRLRALGLDAWFPPGKVTVGGIPFQIIPEGKDVVQTPHDIDENAGVDIGAKGAELYMLMASRFAGMDTARMGDPVPMKRVTGPERFVVRVEYADGITDEVFPVSIGGGEYEVTSGPEVYCLTNLRDVPVERIRLRNRVSSAYFVLAAVTVNTATPVTTPPAISALPPPCPARPSAAGNGDIILRDGGTVIISNDLIRMTLQTANGVTVEEIANHFADDPSMAIDPGPVFEIGDDETLISSAQVATGRPVLSAAQQGVRKIVQIPVDGRPNGVPLRGNLVCSVGGGSGIVMRLDMTQSADRAFSPRINFPLIRGIHFGGSERTWYLWACQGGIVSNLPTHQRQAYGGKYPLQVADVFNPTSGGGLALLTRDLQDKYRFWDLTKDDAGVHWRIDYWEREYQPGDEIQTAPTVIVPHTGDWRRALQIYRDWAADWYNAMAPRKDWFQKVFYYQQKRAWGDLRNEETGEWRIHEVIQRYREYFDCFDYLHIFDFGASKEYGRVGDYSHYEELGGLEAMRAAIGQAQNMGVRLGLYIEGYLCDQRGVWGREYVDACDIRKEDGSPLLWPGAPNEHMMCAACPKWRDHLADTYKRVARQLKPDGMYIDQYGFINAGKTCWSREHGHPVPWPPMRGERDTTEAIRASIPDHIANLTEQTPNDLNSQYQDGALSYSVTHARADLMPHRVDLFRFAFPAFKVFQLVQYNDFLDGGWYLLKFPFFNGEGYWLHHGTSESYCEDAHQFLKDAFRILHEYDDAFSSEDVRPLVPTLEPTVYANEFGGRNCTVWTLFNAQFRTYRGDCLSVPHVARARYRDAFEGDELAVRIKDNRAVVPYELGPRGVGCIVQLR